ncbi:agmatine coumaroyltransferase-2-like protein [Carex littledalei]|uniref:Agmatine coumaroyltransferase-2-like protein n=1 Tax=Carex littledalei TaxID=544730 RepID=A0A833QU14_9POAL|nr:agmatine coumaroyltransferase-2-like protein [Carex littledalei]
MKITIESSRLVKPNYNNGNAPSTNHHFRLSAFDKITYNIHFTNIYTFNPPTLISNIAIEEGLSKVLAEYREFAGRLGEDPDNGNSVIFLNDQGVRFIETTVDSKLEHVLPSKPTKEIESMYPSLYNVGEVAQVQLTRFTCGSLVLAFTSHHFVADGHSTSNFLVAWGLATRGIAIDPIPLRTRDILFKPREPPVIQYDHHKTEYMKNQCTIKTCGNKSNGEEEEIVTHKVHFTINFINKLRAKASAGVPKPYSRFATTLGHLWRVITKARGLDGDETTQIRISVNGRMRMDPKVPNKYYGNLVLWAFPRSKVRDLINRPLSYAVELIHDAVAKLL